MSEPTAAEWASLRRINEAIEARDLAAALALSAALIRTNPALAIARYLQGLALWSAGRANDAERPWRDALDLDPKLTWAAVRLGFLLIEQGRPFEARTVIAPFLERPAADMNLLTVEALALKSLRRSAEATAAYLRARDAAPANPIAEQNLAAHLADTQQYAECEAASLRAMAKGLDSPEIWLMRARGLKGQGRLDEAEAAFAQAIRRRPAFVDAQGELAQLIWTRTADLDASSRHLDRAIAAHPAEPELRLKKAALLEYAGRPHAAYALLTAEAPEAVRGRPMVAAAAATLAAALEPAAAMGHARRAFNASPDNPAVVAALCQAQIAAGEPDAALETAMILRARWPLNQLGVALLATVWRMQGDPAYPLLYDYDRLVRSYPLETPPGWSSLPAYLADLAAALERSHRSVSHPIGQSLRLGTQGELSLEDPDPAIAAFFPGVSQMISRYIAELGPGDDPLRVRVREAFEFNGAWSVRLGPGGHHANHIHPLGWISSACHLVVPPGVDRDHDGWLAFGQPGIPTARALPAEHFVRPEPGVLVLFPSYMWHGTAPFRGEGTRLTAAFDVVPGL